VKKNQFEVQTPNVNTNQELRKSQREGSGNSKTFRANLTKWQEKEDRRQGHRPEHLGNGVPKNMLPYLRSQARTDSYRNQQVYARHFTLERMK
jgi:hypothetical protein